MKEYITELCGMCGSENTLEWDVEEEGYKAFCPRCGKEMMLCDACMHSEDNLEMKCPVECLRRK